MTALPKEVFNVKVNEQAMFDTVLSDRASRRQGTHKVKNRGEVSGTGKKPWRQKGTGRARTGSLRTPVFVGGGRAFGPQPNRNYNLKVNKKVRRLALLSALTVRAKESGVIVKDLKVAKPSTKDLLKQLTTLKLDSKLHKVCIVTEDEKVFKSANNIQKVWTTKITSLSVEDILHADALIIGSKDVKKLEGMVK